MRGVCRRKRKKTRESFERQRRSRREYDICSNLRRKTERQREKYSRRKTERERERERVLRQMEREKDIYSVQSFAICKAFNTSS